MSNGMHIHMNRKCRLFCRSYTKVPISMTLLPRTRARGMLSISAFVSLDLLPVKIHYDGDIVILGRDQLLHHSSWWFLKAQGGSAVTLFQGVMPPHMCKGLSSCRSFWSPDPSRLNILTGPWIQLEKRKKACNH